MLFGFLPVIRWIFELLLNINVTQGVVRKLEHFYITQQNQRILEPIAIPALPIASKILLLSHDDEIINHL